MVRKAFAEDLLKKTSGS